MKNIYKIDQKNRKLICDKADWVLKLHPKSTKPQKFTYMDKVFYARTTSFRILVNDENGSPVCQRYY